MTDTICSNIIVIDASFNLKHKMLIDLIDTTIENIFDA